MANIYRFLIAKRNTSKHIFSNVLVRMNYVVMAVVLVSAGSLASSQSVSASSDITYYSLPQGYIAGNSMTKGSDGAIWFGTNCTGSACVSPNRPYYINRITSSGQLTTYDYDKFPANMTSGPDGALWFTARNFAGNYIGKVTTSGDVSEFLLDGPYTQRGSDIGAITAGPDGALWFTTSSTNDSSKQSISRITTSGDVTTYALPTPNASPYDIVTGPDGALWFTEPFVNSIGRITTSGVITEYPLPSGQAGPYNNGALYLTPGPDGALWFTESAVNKVGRITMGGAITEYPVLNDNQPTYIATGSDTNIWILENSAQKIVRFNISSGVMDEYNIAPTDGGVITSDPQGDIWFSRSVGTPPANFQGYIGHFNPNTSFPLPAPTNLSAASPTHNKPSLSWTPVNGAVLYNVYANSVLIGSTPTPNFVDNNVSTQGNISYYVTAVGPGGESSPSNTITVVYDAALPNISYSVLPVPNALGWTNANTTVTFNCNDALSGIASCSSPVTISTEGTNQQVVGTAVDQAGNTSNATATLKIDKTLPSVSGSAASSQFLLLPGSVTISASATDALSGIVGGEYFTGTDPGVGMGTPMNYVNGKITRSVNVSGPGTTTYSMRSKDAAGNWSNIVTVSVFVLL